MAPGAKNKFGAPVVEPAPAWSNLSSFESMFTALKKVRVTLLELFGSSRSNSAPCLQIKPWFFNPAPRSLVKATQPWERLPIDFKGSVRGSKPYLLLIANEYSRHPFAFPAVQRRPRLLWIPSRTYFACLAFHIICVVIAGRRSWAEILKHFTDWFSLMKVLIVNLGCSAPLLPLLFNGVTFFNNLV